MYAEMSVQLSCDSLVCRVVFTKVLGTKEEMKGKGRPTSKQSPSQACALTQ